MMPALFWDNMVKAMQAAALAQDPTLKQQIYAWARTQIPTTGKKKK